MRAGVAQGGLVSPVLFSLYVNNIPAPSRHVELALYADDTTIISTSHKSALLSRYLETYLSDLQRWLRWWRIAINVSRSNVMLFVKAAWQVPRPLPVQYLGEPIELFDTARYLGVILDSRLTWRHHIVHVRKKDSQRLGVFGSPLNRRSGLYIETEFFCISSSSALWRTLRAPSGGTPLAATLSSCGFSSPSVFALLLVHL
jgi:hypothetical protein